MILLVEDNMTSAEAVATILRLQGYKVETAFSAPEALSKLSTPPVPSMLVIDFYMPGMDGLSFLTHVRKIPGCKDIPALFVTAASTPDVNDLRQSIHDRALGNVAVLRKPVEPAELAAGVATARQGLRIGRAPSEDPDRQQPN